MAALKETTITTYELIAAEDFMDAFAEAVHDVEDSTSYTLGEDKDFDSALTALRKMVNTCEQGILLVEEMQKVSENHNG